MKSENALASTKFACDSKSVRPCINIRIGLPLLYLTLRFQQRLSTITEAPQMAPTNITLPRIDHHKQMKLKLILTTAKMSSLELREHLENLPQEIYDMVYNLTFEPTGGVVDVKASLDSSRTKCDPPLPLNLMQVSRATRAQYTASYYGETSFIVYTLVACHVWFQGMPKAHQKLLREVLCRQLELEDDLPIVARRNARQSEIVRQFGMKWRECGVTALRLRSEHVVSRFLRSQRLRCLVLMASRRWRTGQQVLASMFERSVTRARDSLMGPAVYHDAPSTGRLERHMRYHMEGDSEQLFGRICL